MHDRMMVKYPIKIDKYLYSIERRGYNLKTIRGKRDILVSGKVGLYFLSDSFLSLMVMNASLHSAYCVQVESSCCKKKLLS